MLVEELEATLSLPPDRAPRSEGVHVSAILRSIAGRQGILRKEFVEDFSLVDLGDEEWWASLDSVNRLRIAIGLAWEEWYVRTLPHVLNHPGEMFVQGIYMTHDGESLDVIMSSRGPQYCLVLHEFKTTSKSTRTVGDLSSQWMWIAQAKAYCKGLGARIAFIHVLFLNGDYSYPMRPILKIFKVEFTQAEIDDNWELMVDYMKYQLAQDREEAGLEGGV